jgi:hypothetical protein
MDWPDYLRDQAAKYRQLAEQTDDPVIKAEMLELASGRKQYRGPSHRRVTGHPRRPLSVEGVPIPGKPSREKGTTN